WEGSRMARMAGRFAGILRISLPTDQVEALGRALGQLESQGLRVGVERSAQSPLPEAHRRLHLELVGNDRGGVVRDVSALLASHHINVAELSTDTASAPMSGGMILKIAAELIAPVGIEPSALRRELEARVPDYMVELES